MEIKAWQIKRNWVALIVAVAAFIPGIQRFIADNPELFAQGLSGIIFALSFFSKGSINILDDAKK